MRRVLLGLCMSLALAAPQAAPRPYDETADARAEVQKGLAAAQAAQRPLLVVFGANWCEDCRALDTSLHTPKTAELMARRFVVVKVDVGNFDRNLELSAQYGSPIKKGIPAAVIVSPDNKLLYSTKAGELSSARRMSDTGVYDFFSRAADTAAQTRP